ncbi:MAG: adenosylcobinamide-GDP ribazoletransferase [Solirubrobacteraceae bacterium]
MRPLRRVADGFTLAANFLTVAPVPVRAGADPAWMPAWFPVVGALVGALAGMTRIALDPLLGPVPATVLAAAVLVAATGALHQDGLADCADGLGVRGDPPRRLAVMREPQVGVFGLLAVALWLALLLSALAGLGSDDSLRALVVACALGRWSALLHGVLAPPARTEGLGATFHVSPMALALGSVAALALAFALESPAQALGAVVAAVLTGLAMTAWARRCIGGRTGDTLGASVALVEVVVCLVLLGFARS